MIDEYFLITMLFPCKLYNLFIISPRYYCKRLFGWLNSIIFEYTRDKYDDYSWLPSFSSTSLVIKCLHALMYWNNSKNLIVWTIPSQLLSFFPRVKAIYILLPHKVNINITFIFVFCSYFLLMVVTRSASNMSSASISVYTKEKKTTVICQCRCTFIDVYMRKW